MAIELSRIFTDPMLEANNSVFLSKYWDGKDIDEAIMLASELAKKSPTGRFNFMMHNSFQEDVNFLINAVDKNSYVRPHKHLNSDDRRETFSVVKGHFWVILFEEDGLIKQVVKLDADDNNFPKEFTIETGETHTVISDVPFVTFELKQHPVGGYRPKDDKEFASWSPETNTSDANIYNSKLLQMVLNS